MPSVNKYYEKALIICCKDVYPFIPDRDNMDIDGTDPKTVGISRNVYGMKEERYENPIPPIDDAIYRYDPDIILIEDNDHSIYRYLIDHNIPTCCSSMNDTNESVITMEFNDGNSFSTTYPNLRNFISSRDNYNTINEVKSSYYNFE